MKEVLFWVGQTGILLELTGASLGVWFAWKSRKVWDGLITIQGYPVFRDGAPSPAGEAMANLTRQAWAFGLIGAGLALQFVGNFAK